MLYKIKVTWEFAYEPIEKMIGETRWGNVWTRVQRKLQRKSSCSYKVLTVKVHLDDKRQQDQKREMEEHLRLDHENVLKLLHVNDSRDKTYLIEFKCISTWNIHWLFNLIRRCLLLELCAGTLPPDVIVLYQILNGLHYIDTSTPKI